MGTCRIGYRCVFLDSFVRGKYARGVVGKGREGVSGWDR